MKKLVIWFGIVLFGLYSSFIYAGVPPNIQKHFPNQKIEFKYVTLQAPDIAENGRMVQVAIKTFTFNEPGVHATQVILLNEHNPENPIATFHLTLVGLVAGIATRIKLVKTAIIYVFVVMSDGRVFADKKEVKITVGGCGGGSADDSNTRPYASLPASGASTSNLYIPPSVTSQPVNREVYQHFTDNTIKRVVQEPVSTFSIDVDTGSYANIRRFINQGQLPPKEAVRVEEMMNYFSYDYPHHNPQHPFTVSTEMAATPWRKESYLLRIGIKGNDLDKAALPPANLVFLIDVSGSMSSYDKLPLLKSALTMLSKQLREQDHVTIVVYAGASGVVLPPTAGNQTETITTALNQLQAGGSTHGSSGIHLAYEMARQHYLTEGINRVILATDGDFNVGITNTKALLALIEENKKSGVGLTTLGFGRGNYNEHLMEQLADKGDGNYAYIDNSKEAYKVLVQQVGSTLHTIARDVKIQIEFNPAVIAEYRLIGYENRVLADEDFKDDKVDAGDIGAGHTVTALYELIPVGSQSRFLAPLRYQAQETHQHETLANELGQLRLRYKRPDSDSSQAITHPLLTADMNGQLADKSEDFRFVTAVAAFGQWLHGSKYINGYSPKQIMALARTAMTQDPHGYRSEFVQLVTVASGMK